MSEPADDELRRVGEDHEGILRALTRELTALAGLPGPLRRVSMRAAGHSVEVEWAGNEAMPAPGRLPGDDADSPATRSRNHADSPVATSRNGAEADVDGLLLVRAPLVGTFYAAQQPGSPPFVRPGDVVEKGQTLAIVEAMKLMNHLEAEYPGRVVKVLVDNGDSVEYDQPLLLLQPIGDVAITGERS